METRILWKTLVFTAIIFISGVGVGIWLDSMRVAELEDMMEKMSFQSEDLRLQTLYFETFGQSMMYQAFQNYSNYSNFCDAAIQQNLIFGDRVYEEGLRIERYEAANRLLPSLIAQKKKYVILNTQFWFNSINLKKMCNANYSTLIYFYSHYTQSMDQDVQSKVLLDLKKECGSRLILIALPIDLDITTIDAVKNQYNITETPTLLINEEIKMEGLQKREDLEKILVC
ncbi:MAG: hypothetical protein A7316_10080 [Candidatus Altiarchaeales archaeon WOR_SM1_86-2]|nr:MAG: hypothetical protein A7316_10080 [Candidatus Altiarchaeales archaeon WOR_SM1_86-2]